MVPPVIVNFWLRIGKRRLTLSGHHAITRAYQYGYEAVDVFLPSCGESLELLDNTFRCVSGMRWHGTKTVYVLDDSAREEVRALAARYGYRYVVRANRGELRKAGNLINAFGLSDGEFIVGAGCRLRRAPRLPLRDDALYRRPEGRHRPDCPVL